MISHLAKPQIKGRAYMKVGKDIYEVQTYYTQPEDDWVFDEEMQDTYTNPVYLEQCRRRGKEPDSTGFLDDTIKEEDSQDEIKEDEEEVEEIIDEEEYDEEDEEIDLLSIFDEEPKQEEPSPDTTSSEELPFEETVYQEVVPATTERRFKITKPLGEKPTTTKPGFKITK